MREAVLHGKTRAYCDLMGPAERAQVDQRLRRLELDPSADGVTTFELPGIPWLFLYDDGVWRMTYAVFDDATIIIRSIAHALDLPD